MHIRPLFPLPPLPTHQLTNQLIHRDFESSLPYHQSHHTSKMLANRSTEDRVVEEKKEHSTHPKHARNSRRILLLRNTTLGWTLHTNRKFGNSEETKTRRFDKTKLKKSQHNWLTLSNRMALCWLMVGPSSFSITWSIQVHKNNPLMKT